MSKEGLLGSGGYGCVIHPPLEFIKDVVIDKSYIDKEDDDIAKIFINIPKKNTKSNYDKEIQELNYIAKIDPTHIFTVPFKAACYGKDHVVTNINKMSISFINEDGNKNKNLLDKLYKCIDYTKQNETLYQIILGDGGMELNKSTEKISFAELLSILKKYIEGIIVLGKHNVIHQDIKTANVLLKDRKLNIIDFGLSIPMKDAYVRKDGDHLHSLYLYHPPDYYMLDYIFLKIFNDFKKNKKEIIDMFIISNHGLDAKKLYYKLFDYILENVDGKDLIKYLSSFKNDLNNPSSRVRKNYDKYYLKYILEKYEKKTNRMAIFFYSKFNEYIDKIIENITVIMEKDSNILGKKILYDHIFTRDIAKKIDMFPTSFIILELYKKVTDKTPIKTSHISNMFAKCFTTNSYERASPEQLLEYIIYLKKEFSRKSSTSPSNANSSNKKTKLVGGKKDIINIKYINKNINYNAIKLYNKNTSISGSIAEIAGKISKSANNKKMI
jgi:serine/threonine protein kinase